jgi:hypothetical protein
MGKVVKRIKTKKRVTRGDWLFYKPKKWNLAARLICKLTGVFSHCTYVENKNEELDAEWNKGVTKNKIDWSRKPIIMHMPFDKEAYDAVYKECFGDKYGKVQLFAMGVSIIFRTRKLMTKYGQVCSELLYRLARRSKVFKDKEIEQQDPNRQSPMAVFRLGIELGGVIESDYEIIYED